MSQFHDVPSFSYLPYSPPEQHGLTGNAGKAAGQPRRFPIYRHRSDGSGNGGWDDDAVGEKIWAEVMYGTFGQGSEAEEVLRHMEPERTPMSRYSSSPSFFSTIPGHLANDSLERTELPDPIDNTFITPPSSTVPQPDAAATFDSPPRDTTPKTPYWACQPRIPPRAPLPAWADSSGDAPSLDDICAEYLDLSRLDQDAITMQAEDGYTYDRHDFFYTPSSTVTPRTTAAEDVDAMRTPLQPVCGQALDTIRASSQDLDGPHGLDPSAFPYAQPGMPPYSNLQTPNSAMPSLIADTGSTSYSIATLHTPHLYLNQYTPCEFPSTAGTKVPLPLPPAFGGNDLEDDPFYISPRLPELPRQKDKTKSKGRSILHSLSPTTQTRDTLFHHTATSSSASVRGALPIPPPKSAYGTIDPRHTSSPTGSQLFRPSPPFGPYPVLPLRYGPDVGEEKQVKPLGSVPFLKRNLAAEGGDYGTKKEFAFGAAQMPLPGTVSVAQLTAATDESRSAETSVIHELHLARSSKPAEPRSTAQKRGTKQVLKGKGKKSQTKTTKHQAAPHPRPQDAFERERGSTPTLFATHPLPDPYGTGMSTDDKRGILESFNANTQPAPSSFPRSPIPAHPGSMTFLSPDNTPTKKEKSALRATTKRILDLIEPRGVDTGREKKKGRTERSEMSSPVSTDAESDEGNSDVEEHQAQERKRRTCDELEVGRVGLIASATLACTVPNAARRNTWGKGKARKSDPLDNGIVQHGSALVQRTETADGPSIPSSLKPTRVLKKKGSFVAPLPLRASVSASSIAPTSDEPQPVILPPQRIRPSQLTEGPYHKGPAEGLRRHRSKTNFVPPASTRPVQESPSASPSNRSLATPASATHGKAPTPPSKPLGKRKRATTAHVSVTAAPRRQPSPDMPSLPSSPFQRPLKFELEVELSDVSDTDDENALAASHDAASSDIDAEGEDEEDDIVSSDQTDTDDWDEEYQQPVAPSSKATNAKRAAFASTSSTSKPKKAKSKATKKRSGQYKRHLAEKRVQMGEGSIQAHTGRGYTETELKLMLPFWDGQSVLSIETLTDVQKTLKDNGFKHREPPALKWYMKNTLHQRILDYAKANPRENPLPKSKRARTSL